MPLLTLECKKCGKFFSSGLYLAPGASVALQNNFSNCPFCGSFESIPNGTFQATVDGFKNILNSSLNPLQDAREILEALKQAKTTGDLSKTRYSQQMESFLEKNKNKIALGIAIITLIINQLTKQPNYNINNINIDQQFYTQVNQCITEQAKDDTTQPSSI